MKNVLCLLGICYVILLFDNCAHNIKSLNFSRIRDAVDEICSNQNGERFFAVNHKQYQVLVSHSRVFGARRIFFHRLFCHRFPFYPRTTKRKKTFKSKLKVDMKLFQRNHKSLKAMRRLFSFFAFLTFLSVFTFIHQLVMMGMINGLIYGYAYVIIDSLYKVFESEAISLVNDL